MSERSLTSGCEVIRDDRVPPQVPHVPIATDHDRGTRGSDRRLRSRTGWHTGQGLLVVEADLGATGEVVEQGAEPDLGLREDVEVDVGGAGDAVAVFEGVVQ